jgi:hypothetical protein
VENIFGDYTTQISFLESILIPRNQDHQLAIVRCDTRRNRRYCRELLVLSPRFAVSVHVPNMAVSASHHQPQPILVHDGLWGVVDFCTNA